MEMMMKRQFFPGQMKKGPIIYKENGVAKGLVVDIAKG